MTSCRGDSKEGMPEEVLGSDQRVCEIPQGGQEGFGLQACPHQALLGRLASGSGTLSLCHVGPIQRLEKIGALGEDLALQGLLWPSQE